MAALAPRKAVPALIPGSNSRLTNIYLPNWIMDQPAALDVSVISTLQRQTLVGATNTQDHALQVVKERKIASHAKACHDIGVLFITLVVETLGGWSSEAINTISHIGHQLGQRLDIPPPESIYSSPIPMPGHLFVEEECHTMDSPPACPSTCCGWHCLEHIFFSP